MEQEQFNNLKTNVKTALRDYATRMKIKRVPQFEKKQVLKFTKSGKYRLDVRTPDGGLRIDKDYTAPGMRVKELKPNGHYRIAIMNDVFTFENAELMKLWLIRRADTAMYCNAEFAAVLYEGFSRLEKGSSR